MADLSETIEEAASGPKEVATDGLVVKAQPLPDLIAADKHLSGKDASTQPHRGLRITKLRMPGARGGEPSC